MLNLLHIIRYGAQGVPFHTKLYHPTECQSLLIECLKNGATLYGKRIAAKHLLLSRTFLAVVRFFSI